MSITVNGTGVIVEGSTALIESAGTYNLSGTLTDGQIIVDTDDTELVTLILNGVNLSSTISAPIYIKEAENAAIVLADGTENIVNDASNYVYETAEDDEPNAAVFSDDDLIIYGSGSLIVTANYNDGITSKDSLTILDGTINVTSVDDGIRGKDSLVIDSAIITINASGDGLKSDNEEDLTVGMVEIISGTLNIISGGDAITAESTLTVQGGSFNLTSGGGSTVYPSDDSSTKGLKSANAIIINGGVFNINSSDDAVHANDSIVINDGTFVLASGDDAMHADATLEINGGDIDVTTSYEGVESASITINGGDINIVSSDDGLNAAGGVDGSGFGGGPGGGRDQFSAGDYSLTINDGYIVIDAEGDGVDANGMIVMNGGTVIVNGPTQSMNGAIDYDGSFQINGGFLLAVGSAGMMQAPDNSSTQVSLGINFNGWLPAGDIIHVENSAGESVLTFAATKTYQSLVLSSSELETGETYIFYQGGSAVGSITDGLYIDETYTAGSSIGELTLSGITTMLGGGGGRGGRGGGRP